jgi:hypothetical protein
VIALSILLPGISFLFQITATVPENVLLVVKSQCLLLTFQQFLLAESMYEQSWCRFYKKREL